MGKIAFMCDLEEGHILPTFALAHSLKQRGHEICYTSVTDNRRLIEEQGFYFFPLFEELYPSGFKDKFKVWRQLSVEERAPESVARRTRHLRHILTTDAYGRLLGGFKPDLIMISFYLPYDILVLYFKYGLRPVLIGPVLRESNRPVSYLLEMYMRIITHEEKMLLLNFMNTLNLNLQSLQQLTNQLNSLHEVVLCPGEFDFNHPIVSPTVHYVEPSIRKFNPLFNAYAEYGIPSHKKIIYACMGSQAFRYGHHCDLFFNKVIDIMKDADADDLHLILCVGDQYDQTKLGPIPGNVTVLVWAPQIDILQKTSVAIIHGGLGGIKECIYHGVPMIILPEKYDQPMNARRIKYHGIGFAGDIETITENELKEYLFNALHSDDIKNNMKKMQQVFRDMEEKKPGAIVIERLMGIEQPAPPQYEAAGTE